MYYRLILDDLLKSGEQGTAQHKSNTSIVNMCKRSTVDTIDLIKQFPKQNNLESQPMTQKMSPWHGTLLDDTQVEAQNCCHSIMRSKSSKSETSLKKATFHILKPASRTQTRSIENKDGKLTTKSFYSPTPTVKTASILEQDRLLSIQHNVLQQRDSVTQIPSEKRSLIAKKCLEYKNRQIREHLLQPQLPQLSLFITPRKHQESSSTEKDTPREIVLSNLFESNKAYDRYVCSMRESQKEDSCHKRGGINLKVSKSKKTLQRLYQQHSGRKIEVVESQVSEIDGQSVVLEHDWHHHL